MYQTLRGVLQDFPKGCCLFCFDNCTISFAAKMRHKVRSTFSPGRGKINIGKYGRGKRFVSGLKR